MLISLSYAIETIGPRLLVSRVNRFRPIAFTGFYNNYNIADLCLDEVQPIGYLLVLQCVDIGDRRCEEVGTIIKSLATRVVWVIISARAAAVQ